MRYFYYLTGWLACWLAAPAVAQVNSSASSPSEQHFAPMNDWQLPTFVANSSSDNTSSHKSTTVVTPVKLTFGDSHPASAPAAKTSKVTKTAPASHPAPTQTASVSNTKSDKTASVSNTKQDKTPSASGAKSEKITSIVSAAKPNNTSHLPASSVASTTKSDSSRPVSLPTASTKPGVDHSLASTVEAARNGFSEAKGAIAGRLARLTAYWAGEGDYYTGRHLSSTGIHLHGGVCAVDPSIIPYGSVVVIPGVGQFLAADTGSAVVSREAAREAGRTLAERSALVIDIFFDHRSDGEAFAAEKPKYVPISWWTPSSTSNAAQAARGVFADEDWNKIYSKQL